MHLIHFVVFYFSYNFLAKNIKRERGTHRHNNKQRNDSARRSWLCQSSWFIQKFVNKTQTKCTQEKTSKINLITTLETYTCTKPIENDQIKCNRLLSMLIIRYYLFIFDMKHQICEQLYIVIWAQEDGRNKNRNTENQS